MASIPILYFGYGSNLWKDQMIKRCPTSSYLGIARLNGYRWLINHRGYANVIEPAADTKTDADVVWGLVYTLTPDDEARLDINEGVPIAYTKEILTPDFWAASNGSKPDVNGTPIEAEMLVYIDRKRVQPDLPKKEYIYRMNMGIKGAVAEGMPKKYVDEVLRKFIPEEENESVQELAEKQAVMFVDEEGNEYTDEEGNGVDQAKGGSF